MRPCCTEKSDDDEARPSLLKAKRFSFVEKKKFEAGLSMAAIGHQDRAVASFMGRLFVYYYTTAPYSEAEPASYSSLSSSWAEDSESSPPLKSDGSSVLLVGFGCTATLLRLDRPPFSMMLLSSFKEAWRTSC